MTLRGAQHVLRLQSKRLHAPIHPNLHLRPLSTSSIRRNVPRWPQPPGQPQTPINPSDDAISQINSQRISQATDRVKTFWEEWSSSPSFQAALTTVVGLMMVFAGGVGYLSWYKSHVLHRVQGCQERVELTCLGDMYYGLLNR